jgi:Ca-activated chloride channel homolog
VVLATSRRVIDRLDWKLAPPTWATALTSGQPMAVPNPLQHTESLQALAAAWVSLGRGRRAREAVAAVRLETGRVAGLGPQAGLTLGRQGTGPAPLVPVTEQQVIATNRTARGSWLAAVYPADGSPIVDYPVLRVRPGPTGTTGPASQDRAVDDVAVRLTSDDAMSAATADGFRVTAGTGIPAAGVSDGPVKAMAAPTPADLGAVSSMLRAVGRPMRMLALLDASLSMSARVADGSSRIDLATLAAKRGADLMPDSSSVGLWGFARRIYGRSSDWLPIAAISPLGAREKDGLTHRQHLLRLDIDQFGGLQGGGTALYDSVAAAVREVDRGWQPTTDNSVVVFTDGANDRSGGLTLSQLVDRLRAQRTGGRPVAVYGIGIGPDVDLKALQAIAAASGGRAYQVNSAAEIRDALIDGVSYRALQNLLRATSATG